MTATPEPPADRVDAIVPWAPDARVAPAPDPDAEPDGFVVLADGDVRLHFHDWGGPSARIPP